MKHLHKFNESEKLVNKVKYLMTDVTDNHDVKISYYDDSVSGAEFLEVYIQFESHNGTYMSSNAVDVSADNGRFSELNEKLDEYYNIIKKCQKLILKLETEGYKSSYMKVGVGSNEVKMTIWDYTTE